MKIVAIGGGEIPRPKEDGNGWYPDETSAIDKEIIRLTGKKNPSLLFIATALGDSVNYYESVKNHFTKLGCSRVDPLYLSQNNMSAAELEKLVLGYDAVYVGGGDTQTMMQIWNDRGLDNVLKKAADQDIVLSGLSAGAMCWFKYGNSDSLIHSGRGDHLIRVDGLGLIDALCCPHYDTESIRKIDLPDMMRSTDGVAIAIDESAALMIDGDKFRVVTSKPGAKAYRTYWNNSEFVVENIQEVNLYSDLARLTKNPIV